MLKILNSRVFKVLFVIACIAIFAVSLIPGKQLPSNLIWDKAGHFIAYFGLAFIARIASKKHPSWQLLISCIGFSFAIELLQQLIPNRGFEWYDLLANSLGVVFGLYSAKFLKNKFG